MYGKMSGNAYGNQSKYMVKRSKNAFKTPAIVKHTNISLK